MILRPCVATLANNGEFARGTRVNKLTLRLRALPLFVPDSQRFLSVL